VVLPQFVTIIEQLIHISCPPWSVSGSERNLFPPRPYISIEVEPVRLQGKPDATHKRRRLIMDAKYNWLIDNVAVRVTLNTVAFALWIATAVALLEVAAKL
jgi:hypothetical protein